MKKLMFMTLVTSLLANSAMFAIDEESQTYQPNGSQQDFTPCTPIWHYFKQKPSKEQRSQEYAKLVNQIYDHHLTVYDCIEHVFEEKRQEQIDNILNDTKEILEELPHPVQTYLAVGDQVNKSRSCPPSLIDNCFFLYLD